MEGILPAYTGSAARKKKNKGDIKIVTKHLKNKRFFLTSLELL
jgi:hypothetical protein